MILVLSLLGSVVGLYLLAIIFTWVSYRSLIRYPESKFSLWVRKHIVTDQDLDPPTLKG